MRFVWDERKRRTNLKVHGLDFRDAPAVFDGGTYTFEDDRFDYDERRYMTLGFLGGTPVSIVHTENPNVIRIIPFRKATGYEEGLLYQVLKN